MTSPEYVGVYSWAAILYTLTLAISDSAARQVLVPHAESAPLYLTRYARWVTIAVPPALFVGMFFIVAQTAGGDPEVLIALVPLCVAPVATAWGLGGVARLQLSGQWHVLARGQLVAAFLGLAVSVTLVLSTHSIMGASLHLLISETLFAIYARTASRTTARGRRDSLPAGIGVSTSVGGDFSAMALYGGLAWSQGQSDRVWVGLIGSPANLGAYSVSAALARSLGDAAAASAANVLRAELTGPGASVDPRRVIDIQLRRSLVVAILCTIAVWGGCSTLAAWVLGPTWSESLQASMFLAIAVVPSALSWSASVLQVRYGAARRALAAPIVGNLLAPVIGVLAIVDLRLAAGFVLVREFAVVAASFRLLPPQIAPWAVYVRSAIVCVPMIAVAALLSTAVA